MTRTGVPPGPQHLPEGHPAVRIGRIGVLLVNLGTPDGTGYWPMRRYLKEFLSDRRVIEEPRLKWWLILNLIILTVRPGRKGKDYATHLEQREERGAPQDHHPRSGREAARLCWRTSASSSTGPCATPTRARESRLVHLKEQGCDRILLVPLYPQYAAATTATACDQAFRALMRMRWQPSIRIAPPYFEDPVYIDALAASIRDRLAGLDFEPETLIVSFHGMPQKYLEAGDPYHCQCQKTSRLLREKLGLPAERWLTTFQSQFGTDPWLQPYTIDTVERLARSGLKRIAIVSPGFSADCLETLEELDIENRQKFLDHGGEKFAYIPCLNDSPGGMRVIEQVVRRELAGWL